MGPYLLLEKIVIMEARLYVGRLSYHTNEQTLRELFMQVGNVVSVALTREPGTQRSKGFASVEMSSASKAQKLKQSRHELLKTD